MNRREFLRTGLLAGAALQFPHFWIKAARAQRHVRITLLQTNDTHSRIDPFPMDGGRYQGLGGIARRSSLVKQIRQQNPLTLLVDAGDVLQGTPYFNLFKGTVEYKTMSRCDYFASTLGNHEFDNGVDALFQDLQHAEFDIVNCNFDFGETPLSKRVKTFTTQTMGPIKIGITGVGIDFVDLVAPKNHQGVQYINPFKPLQRVVNYMRNELECSLILVLSHLGYQPHSGKPGDTDLAREVDGIDWIVGGHSHTFMDKPDVITSKGGHTTRILQVGWAGIILGRTDFIFEENRLMAAHTHLMTVDESCPEYVTTEEMLA
ncbi:MAG: metallophosphatase [Calditrichia bacterium]